MHPQTRLQKSKFDGIDWIDFEEVGRGETIVASAAFSSIPVPSDPSFMETTFASSPLSDLSAVLFPPNGSARFFTITFVLL